MNQPTQQTIRLSSGTVFQITPNFLNSVLEAWIVPDQVLITSVRQGPLIGGDSFNATLLRLYLTYDQPPTTAPKTLIAKLPTLETELYERAQVFQPGSRENWFYRSGAALSPMQVPRCYLNESDRSSGESILLLEDLAPASPGSWLVGATLYQAGLALEFLARLHAYWWGKYNSKEIQELNRLLSDNLDNEQNLVQELYDSAWPQFVSQMGAALPDDIRCFGEATLGNMKMVDDLSDLGPSTLVHGDYPRNMCSSFVQGVLSATLDGETCEYDQQLAHVISERFIAAAQRLQLLEFIHS